MLVALSFSSITCFRMVRDDLMASFNDIDFSRQMLTKKQKEKTMFIHNMWCQNKYSYSKSTDMHGCSFTQHGISLAVKKQKHVGGYLVVDLLQRALCSLRCWADCSGITLHKRSRWIHVVSAFVNKRFNAQLSLYMYSYIYDVQTIMFTYSCGPFSSTPPNKSATPKGRLCSDDTVEQ